ncbi:TetR/AcrR family transcriptional regulator [Streptomyces sp. DSM 44917]|uniref:TetR/AcrR family transcriptional regulator n=1 Tax=Streptomyces boetiae TaxID=3075541 RepID=A0ABU2LCA8_9ACTN|nr:TetR/AcrR family transcriptional regulator [Streptomyces sp. DSM 44917]MDT0309211.1 TetR/AcrR family transcriptional regulator [Streptomyces sp. DSM 44917]
MARKPDPGTRDRILDAACRLFDERGVRAVGMQQIIDAGGCGKNLLYREFPSKDELVVAWLERCSQGWPQLLEEAERRAPGDPAEQLATVIGLAVEGISGPGFRGCALRNAHAEFPDPEHPAHRFVVEHYGQRRADLCALAERAGADDPEALADRLSLILDGASANGAILGPTGAAPTATAFARAVIASATEA